MRAVTTAAVFLLGLGAVILPGCAPDDRPAVILVIMDTVRSDRFGCTGHEAASTSTIDSLATTGIRYATTVTSTPVTAPAITTILSGALPTTHLVRDNGMFVHHEDLELLSQGFRDAGYATGAVVAAVPLLARFGFDRAFDIFDDSFEDDPYRVFDPVLEPQEDQLGANERRAEHVTDRALAWLDELDGSRPPFLVVHYYDPHTPADPPPRYLEHHCEDPYDAEIAYMDDEIGRLLAGARDRLGDRPVKVVAVGDHGEAFFRHDEPTHGFFVYDTTVLVPMIFSGEGAPTRIVVESAVRTIDVAPTLAAWCGIEAPNASEGEDLTPSWTTGSVPAACDTAYVETFMTQFTHGWSPLMAVRTSGWKRIRAPRPELYGLGDDPAESRDLAGGGSGVETALDRWLDGHLRESKKKAAKFGAEFGGMDEEMARRLASLGYVGGASNERRSVEPDFGLPDPKDGLRDLNQATFWYQEWADAQMLLRAGRHADGLDRLSAALQLMPAEEGARAICRGEMASLGLGALRLAIRREQDASLRSKLQAHLAAAERFIAAPSSP